MCDLCGIGSQEQLARCGRNCSDFSDMHIGHSSISDIEDSDCSDSPFADAMVVILLMTLFVAEGVFVSLGPLKITPTRAVGVVAFAVLVLGRRIRWVWVDWFVIITSAIYFLSQSQSVGFDSALEATGRGFLDGGMLYIAGRYITQHRRVFKTCLRFLVFCLAIFSVTVVIESVMRVNIHQMFWGLFGNVYGLFSEERFGLLRARGWTSHPIMLGLSYAIFVPVALSVVCEKTTFLGRWPGLLVIGLVVGALMSGSSGVIITLIIIFALFAWEYLLKTGAWQKWVFAFIGGPCLYLILEFASGRPLIRIAMAKLHLTSSMAWYFRWRLYRRVLDSMPGHWFLGYGASPPDEFTGKIHWSIDNYYLAILLSCGLIGLAVWIAFMLSVIFYGGRAVWGGENRQSRFARALCLSVLAMGLAQITVALFSTASSFLWLMMGLAVGVGKRCRINAAGDAAVTDNLSRNGGHPSRSIPLDELIAR